MKAAFLLVTASLCTGQTTTTTATAPAACGHSCNSGCNDSCGGHRLRDCFRNLFNRDRDCGGCNNDCNTGCRWSHSCWTSRCGTGCSSSCSSSCNSSCDDGGCKLFSKLRGLFNRDGCGGCGGGLFGGCRRHDDCCAPATMPPAGDKTDPGKKMPKSDSKSKTEVRIINPPATIGSPVINPIPVNAPAIVPAPPVVVDDNRNPF